MKSIIHTGPTLQVKVAYEDGEEKLIGFANGLIFSIVQGQKLIYTVDSPFPQAIDQGAAPSFVRGNMSLYLPKGATMESAGLVPFRTDEVGRPQNATSRYMHMRIYDRATTELVLSVNYVKVSSYTVSLEMRQVVRINLSFEGIYATPGNIV